MFKEILAIIIDLSTYLFMLYFSYENFGTIAGYLMMVAAGIFTLLIFNNFFTRRS